MSLSEMTHALGNSHDVARTVLEKSNSTMVQLTEAITLLEKDQHLRTVKIGVSSSVTIDLLSIYLRKQGLLNGIRIQVVSGNYDDPVSDVDLFTQAQVEQMVLLPFFDNLLPSFEAQLENLDSAIIDAKEIELRQRYRMVFDKARCIDKVYLGNFHRMGHAADFSGSDAVALVLARFNAALCEEAAPYTNIQIIDTRDIIRTIGQGTAFDTRFYFRSKAPYTGVYMNELARRIALTTRGFRSYFYKVLALDCDNTLWGGVVGEDLLAGIKLEPYDYPGNIFWRVQHEFAALEKQGILLALVTKNNPKDVAEVLEKHPGMVLREKQFVVKKINWEDKSSNLRALAKELNVGLDSIVFLDDSSFECEAVRQQLPMVKTIQVPSILSDFPRVVAEIKTLFLAGGIAPDSKGKTEQYRQRAGAEELKAQFDTQEQYLSSLQIKVELTRNSHADAVRISELSQKSNQFNLTTHRYSVAEIEQMMKDEKFAVYSLTVSDKFGNAGLTGVVVMRYDGLIAYVDNFFMSCRIIGRGIETAIWSPIFTDAAKRGCIKFCAKFIPSIKNAQVANFYVALGLPLIEQTDNGIKQYEIDIADFFDPISSWINIAYVE